MISFNSVNIKLPEDKVAVFSDIHGNLKALEIILKDIKSKGIKNVIFLGDAIAGLSYSKECLDLIINNDIYMVLGNHELYYLYGTDIDDAMTDAQKEYQKNLKEEIGNGYRDFLLSCPMAYESKIHNKIVSFQHFIFNFDDNDMFPFVDINLNDDLDLKNKTNNLTSDITIIGHEHIPFTYENNGKKVIDIGSSTYNDIDGTYYTIIDFSSEDIVFEKVLLKIE